MPNHLLHEEKLNKQAKSQEQKTFISSIFYIFATKRVNNKTK